MTALDTWFDYFRVSDGTTDVSTGHGVVYSVVSQTGCTVAIDSSTGRITCSGITSDSASAVFQAVYGSHTFQMTLSLAKSKAGANGAPAKLLTVLSDRQTISYDTNGSASPSAQTTTFTAVKQNSTATVNWSLTDAAGNVRTPVTSFLSAASGDSVTMTEAQFASARNGTSGVIVTGSMTDGSTFTDKISVSRVSDGAAGSAGSPGTPGSTGPAGNNNATINLYQRASSAPAVPSTATTYTFSTSTLSGTLGSWSQAMPATNGQPLYQTSASVSSSAAFVSVPSASWASPVAIVTDGTAGTNGTNMAAVFLYQRAASQPSTPATNTWNFTSGAFTSSVSPWTLAIPTANGNPCWMTTATALSSGGTTDSIANAEWSTPVQLADSTTNPSAAPNRVRFSMMERGTIGWSVGDTTGATSGLTYGPNNGTTYIANNGAFTASNQILGLGTENLISGCPIPVTAGERIYFGAGLGISGTASAGTWDLNICWLNSSGAEIGTRWTVASGSGTLTYGTRFGGFFTVPANVFAAFIRFNARNGATGTGTINISITQPILCSAGANQATAPTFAPGPSGDAGATLGADWSGTLTSRPGNLAALSGSEPIQNALVPVGANGVVNSDWNRGAAFGWHFNQGGGSTDSKTISAGIDTSAYFGMRHVGYATVGTSGAAWTDTGGVYADGAWTKGIWNSGSVPDQYLYGLPVKNGDRVFARCLGAQYRCVMQLYLLVFNKTGSLVTAPSWFGALDAGTDPHAAENGDPARFNVMGGYYDITASDAFSASLLFRLLPTGGSEPYIFWTEPMMGVLPAGQTVLPNYSAGVQDSLLLQSGSGVMLGDGLQVPPVLAAGGGYSYSANPSAGSTTTSQSTITLSSGTLTVGGRSVSYGTYSVVVSGSGTQTFYVYGDDPSYSGTLASGLHASTNGNDVLASTGRVYFGSITITFTTGYTGGGGTSQCVTTDTILPGIGRAGNVKVGDKLVVADPVTFAERMGIVSYAEIKQAECVRITTSEGIVLECSTTAPIATKGGELVLAPDLLDRSVPVFDECDYMHQRVVSVEPIGVREIIHITCENDVFLAGAEEGRYLLHHNIKRFSSN